MVEENAHFDKLALASLSSFTQKKKEEEEEEGNKALNTVCKSRKFSFQLC